MFNELIASLLQDEKKEGSSSSIKPGVQMLQVKTIEKIMFEKTVFGKLTNIPKLDIIFTNDSGSELKHTLWFHEDGQSEKGKEFEIRARSFKQLLTIIIQTMRYMGHVATDDKLKRFATLEIDKLAELIAQQIFDKTMEISPAVVAKIKKYTEGSKLRVKVSGREYLNKNQEVKMASEINAYNPFHAFESITIADDETKLYFDEDRDIKKLVSKPTGTVTKSEADEMKSIISGTEEEDADDDLPF